MHLISVGKLSEAATQYPNTVETVKNFAKKIENSNWENLIDVQADYPSAEAVGRFTVFNIKGNKYRLILSFAQRLGTRIDYESQVAYFKYFLTHADYSKDEWKNDPHY
jgi:mRNA interferase HigB